MKKVLFATTALVATAGMAAAEVSFGGYGRFGLFYDEGAADETRIEQRFRLTITGQTTADNGVEFEGRIRFQSDDQASGASNTANSSAAGFAVTSGGFRLDVGHVSDVLDSGDVVDYFGYGVGMTAFAEQSSGMGLPASGFGSGTADVAPTIKLRYTAGDFTGSASYTDDALGGEEYQVGVGYNFGNYSAGIVIGNEDATDFDFVAASFGGEIGALAFSILVADYDGNDDTGFGFSLKYDVGAATEIRFVANDTGNDADDEVIAIGFRHSLGGGVSLQGGVGQNTSGNTVGDLGVVFNF